MNGQKSQRHFVSQEHYDDYVESISIDKINKSDLAWFYRILINKRRYEAARTVLIGIITRRFDISDLIGDDFNFFCFVFGPPKLGKIPVVGN